MTRRTRRAIGLALALATSLASCDRVPLFAPTESTITLFASRQTLPLNGIADITATVIEQAGTPAHNGTVVHFRTSMGSVDPAEARTQNGQATVRFHAGGRSGTATINAISGANSSSDIEITVGASQVERVDLSATPASVSPNGGTVLMVAVVTDAAGNRLAGVPVSFSTDNGALSTTSATTDENGETRTTLTTNRETVVTARAGGREATRTIRVNALPAITITTDTTSPVEDEPVNFTVTVTPATGGALIRNVIVEYGDGARETLGPRSGTTRVSHIYDRPGTYRVTATVTDANGEQVIASTSVNVARPPDAPRVTVSLTASTLTPQVQQPLTFTATTTPATVLIDRFEWNFGDGVRRTTSAGSTSHVYGATGHRVVTVTAVPLTSPPASTVIELIVQPVPGTTPTIRRQ